MSMDKNVDSISCMPTYRFYQCYSDIVLICMEDEIIT